MFKPFRYFSHNKQFITPKWRPLDCRPADIVALFRENIAIDAPMARFIVEHNGARHRLGMDADYNRCEWSNIEFYIDDLRFSTLEEFCEKCCIDGEKFMDMEYICVLEDEDGGDPRSNAFLNGRELRTRR